MEMKRKVMTSKVKKEIESNKIKLESLLNEVNLIKKYIEGLEFLDNSSEYVQFENKPFVLEQNNLQSNLKEGSEIFKVQQIIKKNGAPLHVNEIMKALGSSDKKKKISLTGSLSQYVRKGKVFTKVGPNTYGLTNGI